MSKRKKWSHSAGDRPYTITVYERTPGGVLYARVWDPAGRSGEGGWIRKSLKHRDRDRAKKYALDEAVKLRDGVADLARGKVSLAQVFALYKQYRSPRKKSATGQKSDERRIQMWSRVLGRNKDPHTVSLGEWERFMDQRLTGAITAQGEPVEENNRKPVRARTVEADCDWLRWVFNWAVNWRTTTGHYLMRENPVRGFQAPAEKNPRRPVATTDRFESIRKVSDDVPMEIRWNGKREERRSYLSELLDIVNGTGRRISAVTKLRFADLRLERSASAPYGAIRWPGDTDKQGRDWVAPVSPAVRAALDRIARNRPGIGEAPLFPSPEDPTTPISRHLADAWLRKAEQLAEVEPQKGSLWHAYRRKWATERKHLPAADVAAAGGWGSVETLQRAYQHADEATMLRVVLEAGELREVQ
jgi:hypothetical protein